MAILLKGMLGGLRGTVGTFVYSNWKGVEVVRSKPARGKRNFSARQLEQQARFSLMNKFLNPVSRWVNRIYFRRAVQMSAVNKAVSYNLTRAMTGEYPAFSIDYARVRLGFGNMGNEDRMAVSPASSGRIMLSWPDSGHIWKAQATDIAFAAVYSEALSQWMIVERAALRKDLRCVLAAPAFSGTVVQAYAGFMSADGKQISDLAFVGEVAVL